MTDPSQNPASGDTSAAHGAGGDASRRAALVEAIRRLEAGETDGLVSGLIADAVNGWNIWPANTKKCPAFTASLDAAVTLVPEGCGAEIVLIGWAKVYHRRDRFAPHDATVPNSPAAALCLAALRARLAMEGVDG